MSFKSLKDAVKSIQNVASEMKSAGNDVEAVKVAEELAKANEILNTDAAGRGAEWNKPDGQTAPTDFVPKTSFLIDKLDPISNLGNGLSELTKVPLVGEIDEMAHNAEMTTGSFTHATADNGFDSGALSLFQASLIVTISVSRKLLKYSSFDIEAYARKMIDTDLRRMYDKYILNADSATSGNVNLDGGTPASTKYYMDGAGNVGLRLAAITNGAVDIGALASEDDLVEVIDVLGDYAANPDDLLWICNQNIRNKMLKFDTYKTIQNVGGNNSALTGTVTTLMGSQVAVSREMPARTASTGKVHNTGGNNTTGSILLVYKPAIRFGWGVDPEVEVEVFAGKGIVLTATVDFGASVANALAGYGATVAMGANITL